MTIPDNSDRPGARIPCETRNVFGFSVAVSSVEEMSAALAERALEAEAPFLVAAADAHVVTLGVHDRDYGNVLERMDVICPDGMPVVWRLNRRLSSGEREACRVSGPDLMEALVRSNVQYPGLRHFLLGGDEKLLEALSGALKEKYPGFQLAGAYSPPFRPWTEEDLENMREAVASSGANVVWVGLGCPKQERWMAEQRELLPPAVYVGVGAAFAFHAGTVKRAPRWMQKNGLEWLYRIYREPGRLLRRYVKHNSLFVWYVLTGQIGPFFRCASRSRAAGYFILVPFSCGPIMIPFEPERKWWALFPPSSLTLFFLCSFAVFPGKTGMKKLWNAFSGTGSCAWKSCSPSVSFVWKAVFCAGRHCWTASSAWNWKYTRTVLFMQRYMMRTGRISGMLTRERRTGCGQECSAGNMRKNCGMWRNAALNLIFSRRLPPEPHRAHP